MRLSIKTKIVLAIGVPLLATYLGMLSCEYYMGKRQALVSMKSHLTELTARQAAELNGDLSKAEALARTLAMLVTSSPDLSADQIKTWLQDCLRANPEVFGMCMAFEDNAWSRDRKGFAPYYCRAQPTQLRHLDVADVFADYTSLPWYRPASLGHPPSWTEPYFDKGISDRMLCTYSTPFFRDGNFRGVVTVDVLANDLLSEDILDRIPQVKIEGGYCILVSKDGTFISHPDPSLIMRESIFSRAKHCDSEELADAGRQMVAGKTGVCRVPDYRTGHPDWMVFAPVKSSGWSLAAVIPEKKVLKPIDWRLARSLGVLVLGCVLMLAVVLLVAIHVTRPINQLAMATESLAHGNLDISIPGVTGNDEVAQLARRFNAMVVELKSNIEDRIREEASRKELEGELAAAREIQAALLPRMLPDDENRSFSLHAVNAPAKTVAGDFFDFFFVEQQKLVVIMSDVSGKGVPAAVYMAAISTRLRDFASPDKTPSEIITQVNRSLAKENDQNMFATVFFGYYDVDTGELCYVNAGHCPPYVVRQDGLLATLEPTGPLVGPFPDAVFEESRCRLEPQDLLVLYTDGVTEAASEDDQFFGEERLEKLLSSLGAMPVDEICLGLVEAAGRFSNGELDDDATVLVLRRNT